MRPHMLKSQYRINYVCSSSPLPPKVMCAAVHVVVFNHKFIRTFNLLPNLQKISTNPQRLKDEVFGGKIHKKIAQPPLSRCWNDSSTPTTQLI